MKNKLIASAKEKDILVEITMERCKRTSINALNGKLKLFQTDDISSYIIKAIKDGKCIKIALESLNEPERIIANLLKIFSLTDNDNENRFCQGNECFTEEAEVIDFSNVRKDVLALDKIKDKYKEIENIEDGYTNYKEEKQIDNESCALKESTYYNEYYATVTLAKDDTKRVIYISYYTKCYDMESFINYILEKIDVGLLKLDSESVKTDKYKIILTGNAVASILTAFLPSFMSKNIFLQESILTNKIGEKVFSDKISIVEEPKKGIRSVAFDNEGTLKKNQVIVENGKFIKKLNNLEYALKLDEEPTGNAGSINNLYIMPGKKTFDELLKDLDNGIVIDELYGLHSGINLLSGNISLQAEGMFVKDGKMIKGLNMVILTTNFLELFNNVVEVGSSIRPVSLSVLAPDLLIDNIVVTGKR